MQLSIVSGINILVKKNWEIWWKTLITECVQTIFKTIKKVSFDKPVDVDSYIRVI